MAFYIHVSLLVSICGQSTTGQSILHWRRGAVHLY